MSAARMGVDAPEPRRAGHGASGVRRGCQANHMAPSNGILSLGLDSLWFSIRGSVDPQLRGSLVRAKEAAEQSERVVPLEHAELGILNGEALYVQSHGGGQYAYLLSNEWGQFSIRRGESVRGKPTIRARVASAYLHSAPAQSVQEVQDWLLRAVPERTVPIPQVSEAHYHADVIGWEPRVDSSWICRVRHESQEVRYCDCGCNRKILDGIRFGKKNTATLQVAVYDKLREIRLPGKADPILEGIWRRNGWDERQGVYRVEARYSREYLRQHGIETYEDLCRLRGDLWVKAMDWVREVKPSRNMQRDRWPETKAWAFLQQQVFPDATPAPKVALERTADAVQRLKQGVGTLASAAAVMRIGGQGWDDTLGLLEGDGEIGWIFRELLLRFADKSAQKARQLGIAPLQEVTE